MSHVAAEFLKPQLLICSLGQCPDMDDARRVPSESQGSVTLLMWPNEPVGIGGKEVRWQPKPLLPHTSRHVLLFYWTADQFRPARLYMGSMIAIPILSRMPFKGANGVFVNGKQRGVGTVGSM